MRNPYKIDGPAHISFSGGRTSAYMLHQILDAYDGKLPEDIPVVFANTGKERPETLEFIHRCATEWGVNIHWLEWKAGVPGKTSVVDYETASRTGGPFAAFIKHSKNLPNSIRRSCTGHMKIKIIEWYLRKFLGMGDFDSVVGLRADEMHRVTRIRARQNGVGGDIYCPLADAKKTARDVQKFWDNNSFDLNLINVNGRSPHGNCDLCFLKGVRILEGLIRENPESADWWIEQEEAMLPIVAERIEKRFGDMKGTTYFAQFRTKETYRQLRDRVLAQGDLLSLDNVGEEVDWGKPCHCTD